MVFLANLRISRIARGAFDLKRAVVKALVEMDGVVPSDHIRYARLLLLALCRQVRVLSLAGDAVAKGGQQIQARAEHRGDLVLEERPGGLDEEADVHAAEAHLQGVCRGYPRLSD